jgi:hypothetical protein
MDRIAEWFRELEQFVDVEISGIRDGRGHATMKQLTDFVGVTNIGALHDSLAGMRVGVAKLDVTQFDFLHAGNKLHNRRHTHPNYQSIRRNLIIAHSQEF